MNIYLLINTVLPPELEESLREHGEAWVRVVECMGLPERSLLPHPWHLLPPLPWLLLLCALRKDKVTTTPHLTSPHLTTPLLIH